MWSGNRLNKKNLPSHNKTRKQKQFERYVDDIICKLKDDPNKMLQLGKNLQKNLEFAMEKTDEKHGLVFLNMAVYVDEQKKSLVNGTRRQQLLEQF